MSGVRDEHRWPPRSDAEYRREAEQVLGAELADRFAGVRLLVLDADGVLTSGHLLYSASGEAMKEFHSHDGLGLVIARTAGLKRAVLTGRHSRIVERRCSELRFEAIKLGRFDKMAALEEIFRETGCAAGECLYMGDDLIDLPALRAAGVAVTVPGAPAELQDFCHYRTRTAGGEGAVREVVDLVLKSAGLYGLALTRLLDRAWQPTRSELSSDGEQEPATGEES